MKVLIACEESQRVCIEFRRLGHEAYSCDIVQCSGNHPEWHIMHDVLSVMKDGTFSTMDGKQHYVEKWDCIIAHPPCTFLTVTGNRWFNVERYGEKAINRMKDRDDAINFFMKFANASCEHIAIENPVGIMSTKWRKPDQIIQPWMFGDPYEKKTCLWLKNLPLLEEVNPVNPPQRRRFKSGKTMPSWYADAFKLPKEERSKLRSKTFPGFARAMAEQWSAYIENLQGDN